MSLDTWDADDYWTTQDYETSARLTLQHWIWNYQLGYTIHPKIKTDDISKPLRIADVAAGNGAWLLDVLRTFPSDAIDLVGLDIASSHFPASGYLPSNVRFQTWDAFSTVPEQYVGAFDLVHIRAIYSAVIDNKVDVLLNNLLRMLKPGGYIQWDESDASTLTCRTPGPDVKADSTEMLIKLQDMFSKQNKLSPEWVKKLPQTLKDQGCEVVAHEKYEPRKELAKIWTDNMLLVWRGVTSMIPETPVPLPSGMGLPESLSRKSYAELLKQVVRETAKGASVGMTYHVFVAKKPT